MNTTSLLGVGMTIGIGLGALPQWQMEFNHLSKCTVVLRSATKE
jgi:hypothetical protein